MFQGVNVIVTALTTLTVQLVHLIPYLIVALIIWVVGRFLLGLAVELLAKVNIKGTTMDDKAVAVLTAIISVAGRIILVLIILDYLGIGRTLIASVTNGLTFAIAIALGLSFGRALEGDARLITTNLRSFVTRSLKKPARAKVSARPQTARKKRSR